MFTSDFPPEGDMFIPGEIQGEQGHKGRGASWAIKKTELRCWINIPGVYKCGFQGRKEEEHEGGGESGGRREERGGEEEGGE